MDIKELSDGTKCDFCSRLIYTKLGMNYKQEGKNFCCKECADDHNEGKIFEGES